MSLCWEVTFAVVWPVTPSATRRASITATVLPRRFKRTAAVSPTMPPPSMTTSTAVLSCRVGKFVRGVVSIQNDSSLPEVGSFIFA